MVLIPIFLLLFAAWMLWGWTVGESKNIFWLRQWCAPTFVITVVLLTGGTSAVISRSMARNQVRQDVTDLLANIELRMRTGGAENVLEAIHETDHTDDPDRDAFDLLDHLSVMNENLSPGTQDIAERSEETSRH